MDAIIKGRYILDTIITLWESVEHAIDSDQDFTFFKIDIGKAYDRIDWEFILMPFVDVDFGKNLIRFVHLLFGNAMAKNSINGEVSDSITLKRSIKQGCPLAPLLFAITLDSLGLLIKECLSEGHIKGIHIRGMEKDLCKLNLGLSRKAQRCFKAGVKYWGDLFNSDTKKTQLELQTQFKISQRDAEWCLARFNSVTEKLVLSARAFEYFDQTRKVAQIIYEAWNPGTGVDEALKNKLNSKWRMQWSCKQWTYRIRVVQTRRLGVRRGKASVAEVLPGVEALAVQLQSLLVGATRSFFLEMGCQGGLSPSSDEHSCSMAMVQQAGLGRGFLEDACWAVESRQHRFSLEASTSKQIPLPGRGAILEGWARKTLQKGFHDLHSNLADDEGLTVYEGMAGF
ncbi:hypothetical protein L7F22_024671 [Adiantum nelumboides]|nr:hypothetical protein [Adiantum nelumboides]